MSWLELFFDLVYVIAISRITHHLAVNLNTAGFLEYICQFVLIYWGWLNGSLHHDLHGNSGLRTRLMTLWQMMIIAALAVVVDKDPGNHHHSLTIVLMIMQIFITYQWWSVGIYDRNHRRYNLPYTILFLLAFGLMGLSLFVSGDWLWLLIPLIIFCNYSPPFIAHFLLQRSSIDLDLSSSMFERLGLFTIIIFGELVLGVVNAISAMDRLDFSVWLNFALAMTLVFALWWIFFTLIARRHPKSNFVRASLLELLYIPALVSLSSLAALLPSFFADDAPMPLQRLFGYGIAAFLICINWLSGLLEFPAEFKSILQPMRISLLVTAGLYIALAIFEFELSPTGYLFAALVLLTFEILFLNVSYYRKLAREGLTPPDDQT